MSRKVVMPCGESMMVDMVNAGDLRWMRNVEYRGRSSACLECLKLVRAMKEGSSSFKWRSMSGSVCHVYEFRLAKSD